mgnify:CR=1 FL=1
MNIYTFEVDFGQKCFFDVIYLNVKLIFLWLN